MKWARTRSGFKVSVHKRIRLKFCAVGRFFLILVLIMSANRSCMMECVSKVTDGVLWIRFQVPTRRTNNTTKLMIFFILLESLQSLLSKVHFEVSHDSAKNDNTSD